MSWHQSDDSNVASIEPSLTSHEYNVSNTIGLITVWQPRDGEPVFRELLVFFPGSKTPCEMYDGLLSVAGAQIRVICLAYDNVHTIASAANYSLWSPDVPDAFYRARLAAFNGSFGGVAGVQRLLW